MMGVTQGLANLQLASAVSRSESPTRPTRYAEARPNSFSLQEFNEPEERLACLGFHKVDYGAMWLANRSEWVARLAKGEQPIETLRSR